MGGDYQKTQATPRFASNFIPGLIKHCDFCEHNREEAKLTPCKVKLLELE